MNSRQFPKKCAVTQDSQPPRRNDTPRSNPNMNAATGLLLWAITNNKAETSMAANTIICGGRTPFAAPPMRAT